jgi:hypothetical protein
VLLENDLDSSLDFPDNLPVSSICTSSSTREKEEAFIKKNLGRITLAESIERIA